LLGDARGGIDDRIGKVLWNGRFSTSMYCETEPHVRDRT
jgi:hypothetical protein